tara:strand:+ start:132 stop:362 length:231 start_codon:yes stop_codon:yes gene_type:complete
MVLDIDYDGVKFGELLAGKVVLVAGDYYMKLEKIAIADKNQDVMNAVRIYDGVLGYFDNDIAVSVPRVCKVVIKQD